MTWSLPTLTGRKLKFFNLFKNGLFDIESFKEAINESFMGKKIVLLNFPNNPSGYTPTIEAAKNRRGLSSGGERPATGWWSSSMIPISGWSLKTISLPNRYFPEPRRLT